MITAREYMALKLQELRKERGFKPADVGKAVGKSGKTVSAWEVGRGQPDADKLLELCRFFDVPVSTFYMDDGKQTDHKTEELIALFSAMPEEKKDVLLAAARDFVK